MEDKKISKHLENRLVALLSIKSIVTILLTFVFAYLAIVGVIQSEQFLTIFTVIIAFYFGTQATKE